MHSSTKREQFIAHAVPSLSDTIQIYLRAIPSGRPVRKKIGISGLSAGITIPFVLMGNVSAGYGAPQQLYFTFRMEFDLVAQVREARV